MGRLAQWVALSLLLCGSVDAQVGQAPMAQHAPKPLFVGLGDTVSGAAGYMSCAYAYNAAYAAGGSAKLCNLQRSSDSHTCDAMANSAGTISTTANCSTGGDNGSNPATWCAASSGSCLVLTAYNQSGGSDTDATDGTPIPLTFGAINGLPCMSGNGTGTSQLNFTSAGATPPYSLLGVGQSDLSNVSLIWGGPVISPINAIFFYAPGASMSAGTTGVTALSVATSANTLNAIVAVEQASQALLYTNLGTNSLSITNGNLQTTENIDSLHFPMSGYICEIANYHSDQSTNEAALISNMTTRW
jgi:hypothetical protein